MDNHEMPKPEGDRLAPKTLSCTPVANIDPALDAATPMLPTGVRAIAAVGAEPLKGGVDV
jgi:hypothetical protein